MTCLRFPVSLDDANAIVTCYGGPDWRSAFLLGLVTVLLIVGILVIGTLLLVRAAR